MTATFVLNEVTPAAIVWLLHTSMRTLKLGGHIYIRDSERLKPNRHSLNYEKVLREFGFVQTGRLDVNNRVDMFGIPRIYQKQKNYSLTFEELFDHYFGKYSVTSHGGEFMQNIPDGICAD